MIHIRPGVVEDFVKLCGQKPEKPIRMYAVDKDGELAGVFGYYVDTDKFLIFSKIAPGHRPRDILGVGRQAMAMLAQHVDTLYAVPEPGLESAPRFLKRLGFWHAFDTTAGDIYQWHGSR